MELKTNKWYIGENLEIMRDIIPLESIDLIATDPPFNSDRDYIGNYNQIQFTDIWRWKDNRYKPIELIDYATQHSTVGKLSSLRAYLYFMYPRLKQMHLLLKNSGSIYLHCDQSASHYLKLLMDDIFGIDNFRCEIVWCYTGPSNSKKCYPKKHDTILFYTKSDNWIFNCDAIRILYNKNLNLAQRLSGKKEINDDLKQEYILRGKIPETWWSDIALAIRSSKERNGYPTQKPLKLYERIILASSNENDIILDPFCGSGTTLEAAKNLSRKWIGIDINHKCKDILKKRLWQPTPLKIRI